jgi:catechol 2,3-dioxygenase-like lactoylglutathione lyase family enzyme
MSYWSARINESGAVLIQELHQIIVFCRDQNASRAWYELAGFEFMRFEDGSYRFELGRGEIVLEPGTRQAREAQTIRVMVRDVLEHFHTVRSRRLEPFHHDEPDPLEAPSIRPWGDVEFELRDPDGYIWAFVQA